jgi:hypothetical protein
MFVLDGAAVTIGRDEWLEQESDIGRGPRPA